MKQKRPYLPPALTELTGEQAIKLVAERNNCSEQEAAKLVDSLRKPPPIDDESQKRSA